MPFFAAVRADQVEVVPVGGDLGPEVSQATEGFSVEELIFDEAVDGFDVALPGKALGWDVTVVRTQSAYRGGQALLLFVFQKLRAIIGLPDQAAQIDSVAGQVNGELFGQEGGVGFGQFVGVTGEAGAGDRLAGGILKTRQFEPRHGQPIVGNILQVFGIGGELPEEFPVAFDRAELLFSDVLLFAGACQLMLTQDSGNGVMTAGQSELMLKPLGTEAGLLAQFDDLAFQAGGDLVRAVMRASALFGQRGRLAGLVAAEPFAGGVAGAAELPRRGFEAMGAGEGDQFLMQPVSLGTHAIELKIGAVHPGKMAGLGRGPFGPQLRRPRVPLAALGGEACELEA